MSDNTTEQKKPSKLEALQKLVDCTRSDALSKLPSSEMYKLDLLLKDDENAWNNIRNADEHDPLKKVWYHIRIDRLKLQQTISTLKEADASGGFANAVFGAVGGIFGGSNKGVGNQAQITYEGDPALLSAELKDWKLTWQTISDEMAMKLVRTAVSNKSKPALLTLMDEGVITPELSETIEFRVPGKSYKSGEYDSQISRPVDVILKSRSVSAINALVEHPMGSSLLKNAKNESVYGVFDYFTDTYKHDTLIGLMDRGLDPNVTEPSTGRFLISNLAYKVDDDDIPLLRAMVAHGMNVRVTDEMSVSPLMQAVKQGRTELVKFLLEQPNIDIYVKSRFGDTVLTLAAEGPNRFEERHAEYLLRKQVQEEYFKEMHEEWKVAAAKAQAEGEKPPPEPQPPQVKEPVKEYPMELISLIQDAWNAGDPTQSDDKLLQKLRDEDPERIAAAAAMGDNFDFGVNF